MLFCNIRMARNFLYYISLKNWNLSAIQQHFIHPIVSCCSVFVCVTLCRISMESVSLCTV